MNPPQRNHINEKTRLKIERLFDRYVENFSGYSSLFPDQFLCPLCARGYPREAIPWGYLSLAHITPEAWGGTTCTLLCKSCNNRLGHGIEGHAYKRRKVSDALSGRSAQAARLFVTLISPAGEEETISVLMRGVPDENTLLAEIRSTTSDPSVFERSLRLVGLGLNSGGSGMRLAIESPRHYQDEVADLLDYSIAYHALFTVMGYEFMFSNLGLSLREVLNQPAEHADGEGFYSSTFSAQEEGLTAGTVVVCEGVLGVVVPFQADPSLLRVVFLAPLDLSRSPEALVGRKNVRVEILRHSFDEQGLAQPNRIPGIYHKQLCNARFRLEHEPYLLDH